MMSRLKPLPLVWFIAISNIFVTAAIIVLLYDRGTCKQASICRRI
jgi:hypothetical protein